jgi:hypothetical protein
MQINLSITPPDPFQGRISSSFRKPASQTRFSNLLLKPASQTCFSNLLLKSASQIHFSSKCAPDCAMGATQIRIRAQRMCKFSAAENKSDARMSRSNNCHLNPVSRCL